MKHFVLLLMLCASLYAKAQINVLVDAPKPTSKPYTVLYDSLTNIVAIYDDSIDIHHKSYRHLIGQTILYIEPDTTKRYRVYHKSFYGTPEIKYETPSLPRSSCMNRYWKITDIVKYRPPFGVKDNDIFELTDTTDGKKVYCGDGNMNRDFVVQGFYEKIKAQYVGKSYYYSDAYFRDEGRNGYLINFDTKKYNKDIPQNTLWKCVDIAAYNVTNQSPLFYEYEKRCPVILIFENDSLGKYYSYVQNEFGMPFKEVKYCSWTTEKGHEDEKIPLFLGKFLDEEQQNYIVQKDEEEKQHFAKQRKRMIAKYGKYWGKLVGEGQLEIGMTKQMCRDSWGEPEQINTTTTQYGNHEQWVYIATYVYFDNGKITAIQDR